MTERRQLEKAGEFLVGEVRDATVRELLDKMQGQYRDQWSQRFHQEVSGLAGAEREVVEQAVLASVDLFLFTLLARLEEGGDLRLTIARDDGGADDARELSDGLPGELAGEQGWFARYAKEPRSRYSPS